MKGKKRRIHSKNKNPPNLIINENLFLKSIQRYWFNEIILLKQ